MNEENKQIKQVKQKSSIDFGKIFKDLKKHKKLYYKVLSVTFVLAAIYTLSLPNYYKCTVMLSPELSSSRSSTSLASLASSFGLNLGIGATPGLGSEALFPTLYPELINSTDFKVSLFPVPVTIEGNKKKGEQDRTMSYYDYLMDEQKTSWISDVINLPFKALGALLGSDKENADKTEKIDPFRLTKKQSRIVKSLDKRIVCNVAKKTMVITIEVVDQDRVIAANMADTVKNRLQDFITDYRTSKARVDLDYNKKLYKEAKARYEKARRLYSEYADANQDIILQSARSRLIDLENEMQLQFNAYNTIANNLTAAEAKVQQETPAFTTLQSATVPVKKAGPARTKTCLVLLFLAFLFTSVWILHKEDDLKPLLGLS